MSAVSEWAVPIGDRLQFRHGNEGRRGAWRRRRMRRIGTVVARQVERRQQHERTGAQAERRVRIAFGERQWPLRDHVEGQHVGRQRRRRRRRQRRGFWQSRRRGGVELGDVRRLRDRDSGAGTVRRRQRVHFGRRIAHRQRLGHGRQHGPATARGLRRLHVGRHGRRRSRWCERRRWRECRHRLKRRLRLVLARERRWSCLSALPVSSGVGRVVARLAGTECRRRAVNRRGADARRRGENAGRGSLVLVELLLAELLLGDDGGSPPARLRRRGEPGLRRWRQQVSGRIDRRRLRASER